MRKLFIVSALLLSYFSAQAQNFDDYFEDKTLRLDYTFAGDATRQQIFVDELVSLPRWYGRKQHLAELPLKGNGQITVRSLADGMVIYRHSFSSLFQEWVSTAEAKQTQKSFENVFLVPFPKSPVEIKVELFDYHDQVISCLTHKVDPKDILIRKAGERQITPHVTLQQAADTARCIRVAFVAEGYQQQEMDVFLNDCRIAMESLFEHEPFKQNQLKFNMVAVMPPSVESGTSEPNKGIWKNTPLGSHFDTFYSERYLTTLHLKKLHDVLAGIPYEHIIVLVNTDRYGGGGIYNSYNLTYAHGKHFRPVVVHEFGHSFGGLGDEYPYGDDDPMYFADTEPWEPNLTTKHDFNGKWENLIKDKKAGFIEGGGYLSKGVWRGYENCRMRTNEEPEFCLVCQQALQRLIDFYTK
ncbi:Peptidase M64 N-terminus [Prevotella sp. khp1]|uniref:M64 family metallopeptidase n=1 Tax=Prevotellaceae TaxID=171552 RepID=UPI00087F2CD9|nr:MULTISPECIES: M64 family metallopeptidase [Prevotellaceae]QVJ81084.1 peptidase M64 [Xylanibacter ruminicola]SDQ07903.1 Peptidase M64 N-terminus [Prevotella sp. khp1]